LQTFSMKDDDNNNLILIMTRKKNVKDIFQTFQ